MSDMRACSTRAEQQIEEKEGAAPLLEEPASSQRATLVTGRGSMVSGMRSFADTLVSEVTPLAPMTSSTRPEWCVDSDGVLVPMSTFELWAAFENGAVRRDARAWCEGLECWTPVERVVEGFIASGDGTGSRQLTPTPAGAEAKTNPTAPAQRSLAGAVEGEKVSEAQKSGVWSLRGSSGVFGVAVGSAVAAAAVGAALLLSGGDPVSAPVESTGMPRGTVSTERPAAVEVKAPRSAAEARPVRHAEPGQRRRR